MENSTQETISVDILFKWTLEKNYFKKLEHYSTYIIVLGQEKNKDPCPLLSLFYFTQ